MGHAMTEAILTAVRSDRDAILVTVTIDGAARRFKFPVVPIKPGSPEERWGGPRQRLFTQDPQFVECFRKSKLRRTIVDLISCWYDGEAIALPMALGTKRV